MYFVIRVLSSDLLRLDTWIYNYNFSASSLYLAFPAVSTPGFITATIIVTSNLSLQSPDGGAAMGGIAAHGYVNGKAGAARQG